MNLNTIIRQNAYEYSYCGSKSWLRVLECVHTDSVCIHLCYVYTDSVYTMVLCVHTDSMCIHCTLVLCVHTDFVCTHCYCLHTLILRVSVVKYVNVLYLRKECMIMLEIMLLGR